MTDKELLEYAAKAAGIELTDHISKNGSIWVKSNGITEFGWWNPLSNDGDALRLAVKLDIEIGRSFNNSWLAKHYVSNDVFNESIERKDGLMDSSAAVRRAIVRAAAEIGKNHD